MSATNTGVPSMLSHRLPDPVPADEYEQCPVTRKTNRTKQTWT